MEIRYGMHAFKPLELTEDTVVIGGMFVCCRVIDNGFALDRQGGNWRGWWLNGVKQDAYVWRRMGPWSKIEQFQAILQSKRAGEDCWNAWVWIVDYCQANPAADKPTFLSDYEAADFVAYQGFIVKTIEVIFGVSGYEAIRDAINGQERDRLIGLDTEVIEERD